MTVPPYNVDAERAVLGAILNAGSLDCEAGWRILRRAQATGLTPSDFWLPSNAALYATLVFLANRGSAVDPISVSQALESTAKKQLGKLGPWPDSALIWPDAVRGRLEELAHEIIAFNAIEHHSRIVRQAALDRRRDAAKLAKAGQQ